MKKFIVLILTLVPLMTMAAMPEIDELGKRFQSNENVTVVTLGGEMLKAQLGSTENGYADSIEQLTIIASEHKKSSKELESEINKLLKGLKLEPTVNIENEGSKVKIYTVGSESVSDIIVYVIDGDDLAFINICGAIPADMINDVVNAISNIG